MNRVRRIVVTVVIAIAILVSAATPVYAHSVAGAGATNYKTTLRDVSPKIPGLRVKVVETGSRLELTYTGDRSVYVLGVYEERFLRIDRRGVFENLNAPTTYIYRSRDGETPPGFASADKAPAWKKVSDGRTARWHDHRVHWMGDRNPPQVREAPDERHPVADWSVSITDGTTTAVASGDLVWVPGPSPVPYWAFAVALFAGVVLLARRDEPFLPVALAAVVLIVIDIAHSYAIGFANAGDVGTKLVKTFASSIVSIPAWIVGIAGVWLLLRRRVDGFFALVFTGLIATVVGGIADISNLSRSQIAFALPMAWARPIVAATLGLGLGIAAASGLAIRRLEPSRPPDPA